MIPFRKVRGDTQRVERCSAADLGVDPLFDSVPVAVTEGVASPTSALEANSELKMMVQDVVVNDFVGFNQSNVNDQAAVQIAAAVCRMLYLFLKTLIDGDESTDPSQFNGLRRQVAASQDILPNDTTSYLPTRMDWTNLLNLVKDANGQADFILTSPTGYKNIAKTYQNAGLDLEYCTVPMKSCGGGTIQAKTLAVQGVPVFIENSMSQVSIGTFTDAEEVYAGCGYDGVCAITADSDGDSMIKIRKRLVAGSAQTAYRLYWPVGLVVDRQDALARMRFRPLAGTT
jgi:hypothetical protein